MFKPSHRRGLLCAGAAAISLVGAAPALAQDSGTTIEELVVTAEKREQSLQDVPVAVSAFTSEKRDILGVNTIQDFSRLTPSLTYTNNDRLSIRGFGRLTNQIGSDPSVATYSDGVFSNSLADSSTPSIFIERTEILRGPQGTLYGRNSIGGTINVISKRPTDDFRGEARLHYGNYQDKQVDILVSGPITEHLRFLIGGSYQDRDEGYIKNIGPADDIGTASRHILEAQIEADLGENIVARLRYSQFKWNDTYGVGNTLGNNLSALDTTSAAGAGTLAAYFNPNYGYTGGNPGIADPYTVNLNRRVEGTLSNHHRIHLDVTWNMETMTLKYIGGFQQYRYRTNFFGGDFDSTPRTGLISIPVVTPFGAYTATGISPDTQTQYGEDQRWFSNELNLSSNTDAPVQWIAGLYQYYQDYDQPIRVAAFGDAALTRPINSPYANPGFYLINRGGHLETKSWAVFGQIDWQMAEAWKLTAGLRYTDDEKTGYDTSRTIARSPGVTLLLCTTPTVVPVCNPTTLGIVQGFAFDATTASADPTIRVRPGGGLIRDLNGQWDAVTGTLGVQWQPNTDTNVYLRYSRGYKSGGFYGASGLTPDFAADPEYNDSYELGFKLGFRGRFQINGAVFYNDYQGVQAPLRVNFNGTLATNFLNLDAETKGIELETIWSPIDNLQLMVNYTNLSTEITKGCCFTDVIDPQATAVGARPTGQVLGGERLQTLVGNKLPNSPEGKISISATYGWDIGPGRLTASGSYIWTDEAKTDVFANPLYTIPSFEIADFRLLFTDKDDRYTIIGFVKNAFDEQAFNTATPEPLANGTIRRYMGVIVPRTYGVEVQYRF